MCRIKDQVKREKRNLKTYYNRKVEYIIPLKTMRQILSSMLMLLYMLIAKVTINSVKYPLCYRSFFNRKELKDEKSNF